MLIPLASGLVTVLKLTPKPASLDPVVAEFHVMFPLPSKSSAGRAGVSLINLKDHQPPFATSMSRLSTLPSVDKSAI